MRKNKKKLHGLLFLFLCFLNQACGPGFSAKGNEFAQSLDSSSISNSDQSFETEQVNSIEQTTVSGSIVYDETRANTQNMDGSQNTVMRTPEESRPVRQPSSVSNNRTIPNSNRQTMEIQQNESDQIDTVEECGTKKLAQYEIPLGFKKVSQKQPNGCVVEKVTPNFCGPTALFLTRESKNQKPNCLEGEIARIFVYIDKMIEFEPGRFGVIQVKAGSKNNLPYNRRYDVRIEPSAENTCLVYNKWCLDEEEAFGVGYYQKAASSLFVEPGKSYNYKCSQPQDVGGLTTDWNFRWQTPTGSSAKRDGESAYLCTTFKN